MINAFDDISFDKVAIKCANELKSKFKNISLVTDSQHIHQISRRKEKYLKKMVFQLLLEKVKDS